MADEAPENDELLLTEEVEQEAPEAVEPTEEQDEGEEILTFGDLPEEEAETTNTFRHIREKLTETQKELAKTRKKLTEGAKPQEAAAPVELGPRPSIGDFDYDEDRHNEALDAWYEEKAKLQSQTSKVSEDQKAEVEATRQRIEREKLELRRPNIDASFDLVREALTADQQNMLVSATEEAGTAKMIAALADNPDRLAELASITHPVKFIQAVTRLGDKLKMVKRKAPISPDTPERGSAQISAVKPSKKLAELEKEAERTGDRTKLFAYRRELKAAGKLSE